MKKKIMGIVLAVFFLAFAGTAFAGDFNINGAINQTNGAINQNYTTPAQVGGVFVLQNLFFKAISIVNHSFVGIDLQVSDQTANLMNVTGYKVSLSGFKPSNTLYDLWGLDVGNGLSSKLGDYAVVGTATKTGLKTGDLKASGTIYSNKIVTTGITISDSVTGLPVCIKSFSGQLKSIKGAC